MKAVEGVKHWEGLAHWLGVLGGSSSLKDAVEQFLKGQGNFQPSWRAIIFTLDGAGKSGVANHIRSYIEPVQGRCTHKNTYTHATPCHGINYITVV